MKLKQFEKKDLYGGRVTWYLASGNLYDYLRELNPSFFDFDVQRRIVTNTYLDKLWDAVESGEPIPAFTLTSTSPINGSDTLDLNKTEILDGLQRTYRLWAILFVERMVESVGKDFSTLYDAIKESEDGARLIESKVISRSKVRILVENKGKYLERLIDAFKNYDITLNIWIGLTDEEIVRKMLVLNAGQRSVSSTHQFELLFLHCFRNLKPIKGVRIIREKDKDYGKVKNGDRKTGDLLMSSVVIAIQSYIEQAPLRIAQVNKLRIDDSIVPENSSIFFNNENLERFIKFIAEIDVKFCNDIEINIWLMKDTTLSGLFAALGYVSNSSEEIDENTTIRDSVKLLSIESIDKLGFDESYKSLSSVSTNVGNAVRKAVFSYFKALFTGSSISWNEAFSRRKYEA